MPLTLLKTGNTASIRKISGKTETKRFLNNLGFVEGETVTIVSEMGGNMIINVKDARVALEKTIANKIIV
ncbi:MAG: FeoA family protein [Christensenellaceae bacterium]